MLPTAPGREPFAVGRMTACPTNSDVHRSIGNDRSTSGPAVRSAQIPAVRRPLGERASSTLSGPLGSALWRARSARKLSQRLRLGSDRSSPSGKVQFILNRSAAAIRAIPLSICILDLYHASHPFVCSVITQLSPPASASPKEYVTSPGIRWSEVGTKRHGVPSPRLSNPIELTGPKRLNGGRSPRLHECYSQVHFGGDKQLHNVLLVSPLSHCCSPGVQTAF